MYQVEANVAEEDLSIFRKVIEDLNVSGLCEKIQKVSNQVKKIHK